MGVLHKLPGFPGNHAGASLKPGVPESYVRDGRRGFPGNHAGASLKLTYPFGVPFVRIRVSPVITPGPH